jgi:hypothetical protein
MGLLELNLYYLSLTFGLDVGFRVFAVSPSLGYK